MASKLKLTELLYPTSTTAAITINSDDSVTIPTQSTTNLAYTGTLTGGTGVINIGSGQVYKDATGKVGIGTATPNGKLDVQTAADSKIVFNDGTTTGNVRFEAVNAAYNAYKPLELNGSVQLFATNGTEKMRIDSSGSVGIGTISPASTAKLTVQGGGANGTGGTRLLSDTSFANGANYEAYGRRLDANGSGGFAPGVLLARVNTAPAAIVSTINLGRVAFGGSYDGTDANVVYGAQIAGYSSGTYSASSAATDIVFFTTPSGTAGGTTSGTANFGTERMRIDSSGSLLVGAISNPNNDKFLLNQPTLNTWSRRTNCNNYGDVIVLSAASGIAHYFVTSNGTYAGDISVSGSTTSYNSGSDYRLKENVAPMTGALAKVAALKPVTYNWKADGSDGQGFIAHELQAVVPDCVTGTKDAVDKDGKPQYQGVDTSFLVATLTAAIQELKAEVDALKGAA
jgi:hypothetical protein